MSADVGAAERSLAVSIEGGPWAGVASYTVAIIAEVEVQVSVREVVKNQTCLKSKNEVPARLFGANVEIFKSVRDCQRPATFDRQQAFVAGRDNTSVSGSPKVQVKEIEAAEYRRMGGRSKSRFVPGKRTLRCRNCFGARFRHCSFEEGIC
jgi:hypothetical protein